MINTNLFKAGLIRKYDPERNNDLDRALRKACQHVRGPGLLYYMADQNGSRIGLPSVGWLNRCVDTAMEDKLR